MLRDYYKSIRQHDLFGHVIHMNFNKRGPSHKTYVGGLLSIFIKMFIRVYVLLTFKSLIFLEENSTSSIESMEIEIPKVNFNTTDLFIFNEIHVQSTGVPIKVSSELKSYVDIYFEQIFNKWNGPINKQVKLRYEARDCTP